MIARWNSNICAASSAANGGALHASCKRNPEVLHAHPSFRSSRQRCPSLRPAPPRPQQPSTLRIAMTLADIPVTDGAPDQGTEGIRFMGYTLYDPLVMWDLSSATEPAKLVPGLATKWYQDPADPTKWIFELRQGVKFHHGAPFTADDVIFSLERTLERQVAGLRSPRPRRADRRRLADRGLSQDRHLQGRAADQRRRHGDAVAAQPLQRSPAPTISRRSARTGRPIASRRRAPARGR